MVRLLTADAELVTVRRAWTSLRVIDDFERFSGGCSVFRADDLMRIRQRLDAMLEVGEHCNQEKGRSIINK